MIKLLLFAIGGLTLASGALTYGLFAAPPQERVFNVSARQYAYSPPVIRVNNGDTVRIRLQSEDVVHGFYLEGYDVNCAIYPGRKRFQLMRPSQPNSPTEWVEELLFVANRQGKFRFRCSQTCGYLHPFMLGEFIVEPNSLFWVAGVLAVAVGVGTLTLAAWRKTS